MKVKFLVINLYFSFQKVAALGLMVQPNPFLAQRSLGLWTPQPADGTDELNFVHRFVHGTDNEGAGLSGSGIHASPTEEFGMAQMVFPTQGTYADKAVNEGLSKKGTSGRLAAVPLPSASPSSVSSQHSAASHHTSTLDQPNVKIAIIIGSVLGSILLLAIIVFLMRFISRRRKETIKRWTFDGDRMVQGRQTPPSMVQTSSGFAPTPPDVEQGVPHPFPDAPPIYAPTQNLEQVLTGPVSHSTVGLRGPRPALRKLELHSPRAPLPAVPNTPRSAHIYRSPSPLVPRASRIKSPRASPRVMSPGLRSPMIPRSPSPRTHRQRAIADQIEFLRIQMLEFERVGWKEDGVAMDEMCKKMAWLREQQEGSWALGLTEVTPFGYEHYMA